MTRVPPGDWSEGLGWSNTMHRLTTAIQANGMSRVLVTGLNCSRDRLTSIERLLVSSANEMGHVWATIGGPEASEVEVESIPAAASDGARSLFAMPVADIRQFDGALIVVTHRTTSVADLEAFTEWLSARDLTVIGAVYDEAPPIRGRSWLATMLSSGLARWA